MQLTIRIKLLTDDSQKQTLLRTMVAFNLAANVAAKAGFDNCVYSVPSIHKLTYFAIRSQYSLTAQLAVRAIGKASECFRRDKTACPHFKPSSAVVYDTRIMRFKGLTSVSLASLDGRLDIPMVVSGYQEARLQQATKVGQADLVYVDGTFYLLVAIELTAGDKLETADILGVDLGVTNIAVDSAGNTYTGQQVEEHRIKTQVLRSDLQAKGTRSAKRHLKKIRNKETNYRRTNNHQISRRIVDFAKARHSDIALENLKGIRDRTRFHKHQRARMTGWSFAQLRNFISYKAELAGLKVVLIDPRNTSRTCSECGHCDKNNRKNQESFVCLGCGHSANADLNAARNIRAKGFLNEPIVTNVDRRLLSVAS